MSHSKTDQPEFDYVLLVLITILMGFGLVMLFSASYPISYYSYNHDPYYIFFHQLLWTAIGLVAMFIMVNINYRTWRHWAIPIIAVTLITLVAVLILGTERFGATRQFRDGSYQPSEIAKITIIIYIAAWLSSKGKKLHEQSYALIPFAVIIGLLVGLIVIQPDISTSLVIAITAMAMFFIAGADLIQIGILTAMGGLTFGLVITQSAHAQERIKDFLASIPDPLNSPDFHIREAILALVEGGWFGTGLSESAHKAPPAILPAVHSDSIFAIVGEELGLIGTLFVVALFFFFAIRGIRIALRATDSFGTLLAFGITTWLVLQAFINIAVVTATFPFTGLPLPFFSYGGSSTLANLAAIGILLNISRGGQSGIDLHARFSLWRRNRRSRLSNSDGRGRSQGHHSGAFARNVPRNR